RSATWRHLPSFPTRRSSDLTSTFGVLASFADDMRHLQRSELGEVAEAVTAEQVGSSTMPHKRNPWNFEHVKSLWKVAMPRMITVDRKSTRLNSSHVKISYAV